MVEVTEGQSTTENKHYQLLRYASIQLYTSTGHLKFNVNWATVTVVYDLIS